MTYLLDTNVLSELRKLGDGKADPGVVAWVDEHGRVRFSISVISVLELERGILGVERRDAAQGARLRTWLESNVLPTFEGYILPVDAAVARCCAALHVPDRRPEADA